MTKCLQSAGLHGHQTLSVALGPPQSNPDILGLFNLNPSLILRNIDITNLIEVQLQISVLGQKYLTAFDVPNA